MAASDLLLGHLLGEQTVVLAGEVRPALGAALSELGARLVELEGGVEELDAARWATEHGAVNALVYDAGGTFGTGGADALRAALDDGWSAIHAVATAAFIPSGEGATIVLVAPRAGAGVHAGAVRAALENTARTLSIEWARFAITTMAIAPGAGTPDEEVATLVAFLVSPAGAYFSGCRFELGAAG